MASRFYALMFVALTGILGMVSPPNLALMTVQAQTTKDREAEADRLLDLGIKARRASQYKNAIESDLKALAICRELKDRDCEGRAYRGLLQDTPENLQDTPQRLILSSASSTIIAKI